MATLFMACALFGGTLLICQTLMTLMGLGSDHEFGGDTDADAGVEFEHDGGAADHVEHAHGSTWFFGIVTFRTVIAALTFFGLAGMTSLTNQFDEGQSLFIACGAGFAAMYGVHWLMRQLTELRVDGTVQIEQAVGKTGNVYLRVPGGRQGAGKIHLNLQNRTVELAAWTEQSELPTGVPVIVTRIVGPDTVEVVAAKA